MAYIGKEPANSFISFEKQVFTIVNSQTAYTLNNSVTNENDIRLVINNVIQEPGSGKAYTASGTTLTLSAALVNGTDEMYCVYLGRALQTVNAPDGSVGTAQLASEAVTNAKVASSIITGQTELATAPASTDELLISDAGVLKRIDVSLIGGVNTPAFEASLSANQSISDATATKVQFNTETFDTDDAYDNSSNYRFTPQTAGKYFVYAKVQCDAQAAGNLEQSQLQLYKNGSKYAQTQMNYNNNQPENVAAHINNIVDMNGSSDYLEIFIYIDDGSGSPQVRGTSSFVWTSFGAYKIIE